MRTSQGWMHVDLRGPDGEGKALQILEAPWLTQAWPLELRISREIRSGSQPSGPVLVEWRQPPQDQPALP